MSDKSKPGFRILKFWTNYSPDGAGGMRAVDMVAISPVGEATQSVAVHTVSRLSKVVPYERGSENIAALLANQRWDIVRPAYEAWKKGQEVPVTGLPLGAWPGLSPEQADAFRQAGVRTVQEIAELTDSVVARIPIPGVRDLKRTAAAFLEAADRTAVSTDLAKKDAEIAEMRAQLEEMKQLMLEQMKDDDAPKRRRHKIEAVEEAEAA